MILRNLLRRGIIKTDVIYNEDCIEGMGKLSDNSIDLIVTSPPYYNAKEYSQWGSYDLYLVFLQNVFSVIFKKLKKGRMCAVNISCYIEPRKNRNDESKRYAIPFHFVSIMEEIGYKFLEDIIWLKPDGSSKNRNGGFYQHRKPVAYKPNIINEYIFVFQKPSDNLIDDIVKEVSKNSLVKERKYERNNIWKINPKTNSKHPAPFPLEIPVKLIKYYSFVQDIILEPFGGSGTTAKACQNLNRQYILFEKKREYVEMTKNRLRQKSLFS